MTREANGETGLMVKLWHFVAPHTKCGVKTRDTIMRKFAAITKEKWAFAAVMAIACVWGTNSYAQSDADAVKAAVAAYTAAVDSLDPAKMEALWVHDDTVMDIEPGSRTIAVGWDAVKKFIDGNFLVFAELKNVLADGPHVQIKRDLARSMFHSAGCSMVAGRLNPWLSYGKSSSWMCRPSGNVG